MHPEAADIAMEPRGSRQDGGIRATRRRWLLGATDIPEWLGWLIVMVAIANTTAYIVTYTDPIIISDAWYFLDVFVSKALDRTLHLSDFFAQRGGFDHAQPFRKLLLLVELKHFDLDFRFEALAGLAGVVVCAIALRWLMACRTDGHRTAPWWLWVAATVCMASLNSPGVWAWPLVASAFTNFAFLFALLCSLWFAVDRGRYLVFALMVLWFDMAADDTAVLTTIACLICLGLLALRHPAYRSRAARAAATLFACTVITRVAYTLLFAVPHVRDMTLSTRFSALGRQFVDGGWWQWVLIPLGSSVTYSASTPLTTQIVLGLLLLVAHGWFWWRAWRNAPNAATLAAVVLMLLFYAWQAGIIYGRIPYFGNSYLLQPRYVMLYAFNLVALLLMVAASWRADQGMTRVPRWIALAASILFVLWQVPLSNAAWRVGPYQWLYQRKMAAQIWYMADHDAKPPGGCLPLLVVCNWPEPKRARLVQLLKEHKLNVFSPRFQRANHLMPPDNQPQP